MFLSDSLRQMAVGHQATVLRTGLSEGILK
jgi:hypothetical protein